MRRLFCHFPLLSLAICLAPFASAQRSIDLNIGFGTARVGSNGSGLDNANSLTNPFGSCSPTSGDTFCQANPGLGGFFLGLGGDVMIQKHLGFGAEVNLQPSRSDYGPLQYRQTFYDFNGIYAPINEKRVQLQLQAGIGGASTNFAVSQSACVGTAVCSNVSQTVGNSTHFQLHAGIGLQLFLSQHLFIRPQFDLHYVPGLTDQFGSNAVPEGTVWLGYTFGDRN